MFYVQHLLILRPGFVHSFKRLSALDRSFTATAVKCAQGAHCREGTGFVQQASKQHLQQHFVQQASSKQHLQQHFVQQASSKQQLQQDCPMPPLSLAANKVATYPPKKGHNRLIGVATKWTIAHLSVRSNSKIERDLRPAVHCVPDVTKTLFGASARIRRG